LKWFGDDKLNCAFCHPGFRIADGIFTDDGQPFRRSWLINTVLMSLTFLVMHKHFRTILAGYLFLLCLGLSLPFTGSAQNFPPMSVVISDSSATVGYYFLSPYTNMPPFNYEHPLMVLDRYGRIVFYKTFAGPLNQNITNDFKLQPDGRMSFFNTTKRRFFLMDSTFTVVDSIGCVNDFETDTHDLQVLPDHHYLLLGMEVRIMNLSSYHWFGPNHTTPGGTNAQVTGVVVQEFDENKALIWEWKGHDHYQFGDVDQEWLSTPNIVSWTHANAVERDNDGNILISLRHFNEITKIDRNTGDIIWRLGGKANQFTFLNDPVRFTGQHDIRRVSDTSVSIFDNGQYTNPPMARALEYALDETNKTANLVWEYIYDSSKYSSACGNHQYIGNGNHLIDYGFFWTGEPWMVVVKPDKTKVLEISLPNRYISYRAFNYPTLPWSLNRPAVTCEKIGTDYYLVAEEGFPEYKWSTGATTSSIPITSTGDYWVFVPYGEGYLSSEHISITDILNPCVNTATPDAANTSDLTLRCSPNPAKDRVEVLFDLPAESQVTLSMLSLWGIEIKRAFQGYCRAGKNMVLMDISALDRGVYLLSLKTGDSRIINRLIIQ